MAQKPQLQKQTAAFACKRGRTANAIPQSMKRGAPTNVRRDRERTDIFVRGGAVRAYYKQQKGARQCLLNRRGLADSLDARI
nr:MAG TPA: hypothetical protein [Caudoviricetes sp.]